MKIIITEGQLGDIIEDVIQKHPIDITYDITSGFDIINLRIDNELERIFLTKFQDILTRRFLLTCRKDGTEIELLSNPTDYFLFYSDVISLLRIICKDNNKH
jgi:hypothetical protein